MTPYLVEDARVRLRPLVPEDESLALPGGEGTLRERIEASSRHPVHAWTSYTLAVCAAGTDASLGYAALAPFHDGFRFELSAPEPLAEDAAALFLRFVPHRFGICELDCGGAPVPCAWEAPPGGQTLYGERVTLRRTRSDAPDTERGWVASEHFDMYAGLLRVGTCSLRTGYNEALFYGGNLSYTVFPAFRGRGYAADAARTMAEFAFRAGLPQLAITCVPDNTASRKTALRAGFRPEGVFPIPKTLGLYAENRREACRYVRKPGDPPCPAEGGTETG